MTSSLLSTIMQGISIVTFNGDPGITAISNDMQRKADHDGTPIATLYNGIALMAMPRGEAKLLIEGYYELAPKASVLLDFNTPEFLNREHFYNDATPTPPSGLSKLPNFIDWVRSLKLPGEYSIQR